MLDLSPVETPHYSTTRPFGLNGHRVRSYPKPTISELGVRAQSQLATWRKAGVMTRGEFDLTSGLYSKLQLADYPALRTVTRPQRWGMATLRLFSYLREAAGVASVTIHGTTVGEVLDHAVTTYGERFAKGLESAQVWVNGTPATSSTNVSQGDEIALIPPVSGGSAATRSQTDIVATALVITLIVTLVVGNLVDTTYNQTFVLALVGAGMAWLWDLSDTYRARGGFIQIIPAILAVAVTANGAYRWGPSGLAGGVAIGISILLIWAVLDPRQRSINAVTVSLLVGLTASIGAGALVIVRLRSPAEIGTFLAVMSAAAAAASLAQRWGSTTTALDPNIAGLLAGLVAAAVSGYVADTVEIVNALLAAALAGGGFIAGRTIGAAVRMGNVLHTVRGPGLLTAFDGPIAAAPIFWIALLLVT